MGSESEIGFVHGKSVAFVDLPYSQWTDYFLSLPVNESEVDVLTREIGVLKPKIKEMLTSKGDDETLKSKVLLIQLLVSLGLAFHFENEIKDVVGHAFQKIDHTIGDENDLHTISTMFRVFRTYGHNISSDIFERFKRDDGKFEESLATDVKCILGLYEAAHMATTNDHILDEALTFASSHLKSLVARGTHAPHILRLIRSTLYLPQRWNMEAIVAKEYILFYEQEEAHDKMLLKLAKLSFKLLQLHYIKELQTLIKWRRDLDLTSKLPPQFRDKIVEAWFAGLLMHFDPQFSSGRIIAAKLTYLLTIHDDACDDYYSIHELEKLIDCVERWNPNDANTLEGVLRLIFQLGFEIFDDIERGLRSQGISHYMKEILEEFKTWVKANFKLLKWAQGTK